MIATAPQVMLLEHWGGENPAGWLASRKWDGVRALWDDSRLWSRNGREIPAPAWFTDSLPAHPLDGELVLGDDLGRVMSVFMRGPDADWSAVQYMVFDAPISGPVEARLAALRNLALPEHCELVEHTEITGMDHFDRYLQRLQDAGAEGTVLRRAGSHYQHGRSGDCLKYRF